MCLIWWYNRITTITQCTTNCHYLIYRGHCFCFIIYIGNVDSSIFYFCRINPMTCSTWMRTQKSLRAASTFILLNCLLPCVKCGSFTSAQYRPAVSWMVNPLSANTISPGNSFCNNPEFSVKCTSDVLPPQPCEIYVTDLWGVMPIRNFTVLQCL